MERTLLAHVGNSANVGGLACSAMLRYAMLAVKCVVLSSRRLLLQCSMLWWSWFVFHSCLLHNTTLSYTRLRHISHCLTLCLLSLLYHIIITHLLHIINKFCYHVLLDRINFCCIIHYLISMCCIYYIAILPQDPWDIHYSIHLYHIHPYTHVFFSFLQFYLLWDKLDELFVSEEPEEMSR